VRSLKPGRLISGAVPMIGIYTVLIFLAVMVALNVFEFGRID